MYLKAREERAKGGERELGEGGGLGDRATASALSKFARHSRGKRARAVVLGRHSTSPVEVEVAV